MLSRSPDALSPDALSPDASLPAIIMFAHYPSAASITAESAVKVPHTDCMHGKLAARTGNIS
jgi:hypothetical protein